MKPITLLSTLLLAGILLTGCKKDKDKMPAINGVNGHITNIDGKDIHFASSSGNTAHTYGSSGTLDLEFNDSKSQVKINLSLYDISLQNPGDYTLKDSTRWGMLSILSNPAGQQNFYTDRYASNNGTINITTITNDHVAGVVKKAVLHGGGSTIVTLHDCKFNLKIE